MKKKKKKKKLKMFSRRADNRNPIHDIYAFQDRFIPDLYDPYDLYDLHGWAIDYVAG